MDSKLCGLTLKICSAKPGKVLQLIKREIAINHLIYVFWNVMKLYKYIVWLLLPVLSSCVKPPSYPVEPILTFKSVSTDVAVSDSTQVVFTVSFTDGDGDIGPNTNGTDSCNICGLSGGDSTCLKEGRFNVFLINNYTKCIAQFTSANIEPRGRFDDISGEIDIISQLSCRPFLTSDTASYSIAIRDRAGHLSNFVQAAPVRLICR